MKKYIASYFKFAGVLIISLALFASSCKKDKNEDTPQPTKKELLSNIVAKMGTLLARGAFKRVARFVDYAEYGGEKPSYFQKILF